MNHRGPVRVLIAEDSEIFAAVLYETVNAEPDMEVVAVAADGQSAVELCEQLAPDLVLMDIQMPRMDGLSATERIMADCPTPILVVTADPYHGGVDLSFRALSAGALDLMAKPSSLPWVRPEREAFLRKIRLLAQVAVVRHQRAGGQPRVVYSGTHEHAPDVGVGIVASTGGPRALGQLLAGLPASFPTPVFVVQHIIPGFSAHLAKWLNTVSALRVVEARDGDVAVAGTAYVAPAGVHMRVHDRFRIELLPGDPVSGHLPSGDVLLESLARAVHRHAIGIVMSGIGSDGTTGMAAIHRAGGVTLVQDRESSVVYGMPQSALDLGVVDHVIDLEQMAQKLLNTVLALRGPEGARGKTRDRDG